VSLRETVEDDLPAFFAHQQDAEANRMAAFTAADPTDRAAFDAHWAMLLREETVTARTVLVDGRVAGNMLAFPHAGHVEVGYWLDRAYWGRGVASRALTQFVALLPVRPLYARVARDNAASLGVLRKCGFVVVGRDRGFAHGRGEEVDEFVLRLDDGG
jgi:RimJ/RimL family protein N-acetyltransferase